MRALWFCFIHLDRIKVIVSLCAHCLCWAIWAASWLKLRVFSKLLEQRSEFSRREWKPSVRLFCNKTEGRNRNKPDWYNTQTSACLFHLGLPWNVKQKKKMSVNIYTSSPRDRRDTAGHDGQRWKFAVPVGAHVHFVPHICIFLRRSDSAVLNCFQMWNAEDNLSF